MPSGNEDVLHGGEQEAAEHSPLLEDFERPSDDNATTGKSGIARPSHLLRVIIPALILRSAIHRMLQLIVPVEANSAQLLRSFIRFVVFHEQLHTHR